MTREEAIQRFNGIINAMSISIAQSKFYPSKAELDELCDMAIEALSADTSSDLISRANAIRWVKTECNPYGKPTLEFESGKKVIEHLGQMPSTEPKMKWIPCSERLPKRDELVLVTYKTTDRIHLCRYLDDGSENPWWSYIDDCCAWNNVVLAWMPLPEPYREDGE